MSDDNLTDILIQECKRREESCQYTYISLYLWAKDSLWTHRVLVGLPVLAGAAAASSVIQDWLWAAGILALIAGALPALYEALKLESHYGLLPSLAADYRNLEERFRVAREITSKKSVREFEAACGTLFEALEGLRKQSPAIPDSVFERARAKIKAGRYQFDADGKRLTETDTIQSAP